jgi:hypothetical protein
LFSSGDEAASESVTHMGVVKRSAGPLPASVVRTSLSKIRMEPLAVEKHKLTKGVQLPLRFVGVGRIVDALGLTPHWRTTQQQHLSDLFLASLLAMRGTQDPQGPGN